MNEYAKELLAAVAANNDPEHLYKAVHAVNATYRDRRTESINLHYADICKGAEVRIAMPETICGYPVTTQHEPAMLSYFVSTPLANVSVKFKPWDKEVRSTHVEMNVWTRNQNVTRKDILIKNAVGELQNVLLILRDAESKLNLSEQADTV